MRIKSTSHKREIAAAAGAEKIGREQRLKEKSSSSADRMRHCLSRDSFGNAPAYAARRITNLRLLPTYRLVGIDAASQTEDRIVHIFRQEVHRTVTE